MPLLPFYRTRIVVPVSDKVYDSTIIKQEAIFVRLQHNQDHISGVSSAEIIVLLCAYSSIAGEKGMPLNSRGVPDRTVTLVANNDTLVDVATGALLAIFSNEEPTVRQTIIDGFPQNTMLQGDFFAWLRDNNPVRIGDMIHANIIQADTMNKFTML